MVNGSKPRIAVFSGGTATITHSVPLVTSNNARQKLGLPLVTNEGGTPLRFDFMRPQRLAAPVTVYVEQFTAHPLERDAAHLYGPPDGFIDQKGTFHKERQGPNDVAVYEVTLRPEDGLFLLPYMARQVNGQPWDEDATGPEAPPDLTRQGFFPDGSRLFEEIDRFGLDGKGKGSQLEARADYDFYRAVPPAGYRQGLAAGLRTDTGEGEIPPEAWGRDFFPYGPTHLVGDPPVTTHHYSDPPKSMIARAVNTVQNALDTGKYAGAVWLEGSPNVEETIYLLNILIDTTLPICGNSSQRAHGVLANDGDKNILDSVDYIVSGVWKDDQGKDCIGAVAVLDEQIFTARDVQKGDARPGGYLATGGHGGVIGRIARKPILTFRPVKRHTHTSAVNLRQLPNQVQGVRADGEQIVSVPVQVKDAQGNLLPSAIPEVRFFKSARYMPTDDSCDPDLEVEVLARIQQNLLHAPLAGFVGEGQVGGRVVRPMLDALELAAASGMPVVMVNRGNPEGFASAAADGLFIGGSNLTANKARSLLIACLLKYGSLPPAADPRHPTVAERKAIQAMLKDYQAVFDTH